MDVNEKLAKLRAAKQELADAKREAAEERRALQAEKARFEGERDELIAQLERERKEIDSLKIFASRKLTDEMRAEMDKAETEEYLVKSTGKIVIKTKKSLFPVVLGPNADGDLEIGVFLNKDYFSERIANSFLDANAADLAKGLKTVSKKKPSKQREILQKAFEMLMVADRLPGEEAVDDEEELNRLLHDDDEDGDVDNDKEDTPPIKKAPAKDADSDSGSDNDFGDDDEE